MDRSEPLLVAAAPLPYLISVPGPPPKGGWPLLCFLHGYEEGNPMPIRQAVTRHGPFAAGSAAVATAEFVVVAPQLPTRGDVWAYYDGAVEAVVRHVQASTPIDPRRAYLTGFSFGGNGVFDLALTQPDLWAALWAVDPTRVPDIDPGLPVWLSSGEVSRPRARAFIGGLRLELPDEAAPRPRVYEDLGQDHVGTASLAYGSEAIYRWLLSQRRGD